MTELARLLADRIAAGGPITFAEYQAEALYHPEHGYYAGTPRTGRAGHFLTSPELDPAFGTLWARGFEEIWDACGRPAEFEVIEIGPGEGGFAAAVLDAAAGDFADALGYRLVERVPAATERQIELLSARPNVTWSASPEEVVPVSCGCVFGNEVLDNQPVHILEGRDGGVMELMVGLEGGHLTLLEQAPSEAAVAALARRGPGPGDRQRTEVSPAAADLASVAAGLIERGAVVFVDYGLTAARRALHPAGTLVAYSETGAGELRLERAGREDLTSHADWTVLARVFRDAGCAVAGPISQRSALAALGLMNLHEGLRHEHRTALAAGRGAAAVRALSRRQALGALGDPGGLGGLDVLAGLKGQAPPSFMAAQATPR